MTRRVRRSRAALAPAPVIALALVMGLGLAGCGDDPEPGERANAPSEATRTAGPDDDVDAGDPAALESRTVTTGLTSPWGLSATSQEAVLLSERVDFTRRGRSGRLPLYWIEQHASIRSDPYDVSMRDALLPSYRALERRQLIDLALALAPLRVPVLPLLEVHSWLVDFPQHAMSETNAWKITKLVSDATSRR